MKEIAFKVVKDSGLYKSYFEELSEKQKFHDLARAFFEKHELIDKSTYYQSETLWLSLTEEQRERFKGQIKKYTDDNGMSIFKKTSPMQKEWNEDVVSKVNFYTLRQNDFWYGGIISHGRYALWDYDGEVYGYLYDKYKEEIQLPEYLTEIKMSEYYSVIEQRNEQSEKGGVQE